MSLSNLEIEKIIIHQIFQKKQDELLLPEKSDEYLDFDKDAIEDIEELLITALGADSKAVAMNIVNSKSGTLAYLINNSINHNDEEFKEDSYEIALKLAQAQHNKGRNISGGIVVIIRGKHGNNDKKFIGIIKAEIHSGYEKNINGTTKKISLRHVKELLLTPNTKLFKTIGFLEKNSMSDDEDLNNQWDVLISDNQISQTNGKVSAAYFYNDFAGCGYPQNAARKTKMFFDHTNEFIESLELEPIKKNNLKTALKIYISETQSPTIDMKEFATTYLSLEQQDPYRKHLKRYGLGEIAFLKDNQHIYNNLKTQELKFKNNIKIIATPENFKDNVITTEEYTDTDNNGLEVSYTKITIKSSLISK